MFAKSYANALKTKAFQQVLLSRGFRPAAATSSVFGSSTTVQSTSANSSLNHPQRRSLLTTTFDLPDPAQFSGSSSPQKLPLVKIVATIGPTSEQEEPLRHVTQAGMRIMRLNFSHATTEEVELRCTNLGKAVDYLYGAQAPRAILLDTKGPEIRSGKLANDHSGHETITLVAGKQITLQNSPVIQKEGSTVNDLYIDYPGLHRAMEPGRKVLLDDGAITLTVTEVIKEGEYGKVICTIDNTGDLRSRAGVNLPLADTSDLPAMSDKDKNDIKYGMTKDIDFVAASFVQTADGVRQIRKHIQDCAQELGWDKDRPLPMIISKIESASALKHFDEILKESDGIMVARGDLGVEIPLTQVTNAQKEMVAACNAAGKPVVVATQMLESMAKNPRPTRAEVSDVTNAVYDGADCVMLSGETAKGKYPTEAVRTMNEIVLASERFAKSDVMASFSTNKKMSGHGNGSVDSAVAKAAVAAAEERKCAAILVLTRHGSLPKLVAANRPSMPVFCLGPSDKLARQFQIFRALHPVVGSFGSSAEAISEIQRMGFLQSKDEVVVVYAQDENLHTATMQMAQVP